MEPSGPDGSQSRRSRDWPCRVNKDRSGQPGQKGPSLHNPARKGPTTSASSDHLRGWPSRTGEKRWKRGWVCLRKADRCVLNAEARRTKSGRKPGTYMQPRQGLTLRSGRLVRGFAAKGVRQVQGGRCRYPRRRNPKCSLSRPQVERYEACCILAAKSCWSNRGSTSQWVLR